jgi:molecular chaperone GrpE
MRSSPGTEHDQRPEQDELSADELRSRLEETRAELAAADDRYLRARADLDNYRKRADRELERRAREQRDELVRAWLEVVDSVERALALQADDPRIAEGLSLLLGQMQAILDRQGVRRIGQVGEPFDPELHEAIAVVQRPDGEAGTVAQVARAGYAAGEGVLRPAQVAVARPADDSGA